jgi:hypothetical protein
MNRRVLNATAIEYDGIKFKSKAEVMVYKTLVEKGFSPRYEEETFNFWEGLKPTVPFYDLGPERHLRLNMKKLIGTKYTPDFTFWSSGTKVIMEVKGWANDIYPLKKKMFRAYLETLDYPVVFVEIHTKRQLLEFINKLTESGNETT